MYQSCRKYSTLWALITAVHENKLYPQLIGKWGKLL